MSSKHVRFTLSTFVFSALFAFAFATTASAQVSVKKLKDREEAGEGTDGEGTDGEGTDGEGTDGEGTDGEGTDGEGVDGTDGETADGEASKDKTCKEGRVRSRGRCCWPGQKWSGDDQACVGEIVCGELFIDAEVSGEPGCVQVEEPVYTSQQACLGGEVTACATMADRFLDGDGVAVDESRGERLHTVACEDGLTASCLVMARRTDRLEFFQTACDHGDTGGCDEVAARTNVLEPIEPPAETDGLAIAGWSLVGGGAALVVTGVALHFVAESDRDKVLGAAGTVASSTGGPSAIDSLTRAEALAIEEDANTLDITAGVLIGVGAVAAVGGATLLVLPMFESEAEVSASLSPTMAGLRFKHHF